jgi:L-lactate dehydrogenase complex protein LldF
MGIEKIIPREEHLALFLPLLAASATGQKITTYCHFIAGPRKADELDGPEEVHLVLLDNGRTRVAQGDYREILHCIRCGACLNVCPVYRQASGHAYGHVYSGPLGAVLAPALEGVETMGDLSKASTLCGACEEVCPVKIPIPRLLLQLRDESVRKGAVKDSIPWSAFAAGATQPWAWKTGLSLMPMAFPLAKSSQGGYGEAHELPKPDGVSFRKWWRGRS